MADPKTQPDLQPSSAPEALPDNPKDFAARVDKLSQDAEKARVGADKIKSKVKEGTDKMVKGLQDANPVNKMMHLAGGALLIAGSIWAVSKVVDKFTGKSEKIAAGANGAVEKQRGSTLKKVFKYLMGGASIGLAYEAFVKGNLTTEDFAAAWKDGKLIGVAKLLVSKVGDGTINMSKDLKNFIVATLGMGALKGAKDKAAEARDKLKDKLKGKEKSAEPEIDPKYGEMVPMKEKCADLGKSITEYLMPLTQFPENHPYLTAAGALYLAQMESVRNLARSFGRGTINFTKSTGRNLLSATKIPFKGPEGRHLVAVMAILGVLLVTAKGAEAMVPKDNDKFKEMISDKMGAGQATMAEHGVNVPKEDIEAGTQYVTGEKEIKELFAGMGDATDNVYKGAMDKLTIRENDPVFIASRQGYLLGRFENDLDILMVKASDEEKVGYLRLKNQLAIFRNKLTTRDPKEKVTQADIDQLTDVALESKIVISEDDGYLVWQKFNEHGEPEGPPRNLSIDPRLSIEEQFKLAHEAYYESSLGEALERGIATPAVDYFREKFGGGFEEIVEGWKRGIMDGSMQMIWTGTKLIIEGVGEKYIFGNWRIAQAIGNQIGEGELNMTELTIAYGQSIAPVFVITYGKNKLLRNGAFSKSAFTILRESAAYPYTSLRTLGRGAVKGGEHFVMPAVRGEKAKLRDNLKFNRVSADFYQVKMKAQQWANNTFIRRVPGITYGQDQLMKGLTKGIHGRYHRLQQYYHAIAVLNEAGDFGNPTRQQAFIDHINDLDIYDGEGKIRVNTMDEARGMLQKQVRLAEEDVKVWKKMRANRRRMLALQWKMKIPGISPTTRVSLQAEINRLGGEIKEFTERGQLSLGISEETSRQIGAKKAERAELAEKASKAEQDGDLKKKAALDAEIKALDAEIKDLESRTDPLMGGGAKNAEKYAAAMEKQAAARNPQENIERAKGLDERMKGELTVYSTERSNLIKGGVENNRQAIKDLDAKFAKKFDALVIEKVKIVEHLKTFDPQELKKSGLKVDSDVLRALKARGLVDGKLKLPHSRKLTKLLPGRGTVVTAIALLGIYFGAKWFGANEAGVDEEHIQQKLTEARAKAPAV